jgi:hypothetical protein
MSDDARADSRDDSGTNVSEAAKALGRLGGLKGGRARAQKLSPEERSGIARKAVEARWAKAKSDTTIPTQPSGIPNATHTGTLMIGSIELPCAVLEDGTRVFTQGGFLHAIGRARNAKGGQGVTLDGLPAFLRANNLKPFISKHLEDSTRHVVFYRPGGRAVSYGYRAELLPLVCRVYLEARDAGALTHNQLPIAARCDILIRALAAVGILALVDEATGYQEDRDKQELRRILESYISGELLAWAERFPIEFYRELFRLQGWQFDPLSVKRPRLVGKLTKQLIYKQLPPGVLEELETKNPPVYGNGYRRYKHHQYLTPQIGNVHLEKQVASVTTLMKVSKTREIFNRLFNRAFPTKKERQQSFLEDDTLDEIEENGD